MEQASVEARIGLPAEFIDAIADAVADRLADRLGAERSSPYLLPDEAASYLRCSRQRLYDMTSSGQLRAHRDGRRLLFTTADLDAVLDSEEPSA